MTKTTLILPEQTEPKLEFPLLAKDIKSDLVVLFTARAIGVVVQSGFGYPIGYTSEIWDGPDRNNNWTLLPRGTKIVIEQL